MDTLIHIVADMGPLHWVVLAALLLVLELLTGGTTYLLWPSAAALATGLVHFAIPMGWQVDWSLFAVLTLALTITGSLYVRPLLQHEGDSSLNNRALRMVGQSGEVVSNFTNGGGQVRFGDSEWAAVSASGKDLKTGHKVVVKAIKGGTLTVAPTQMPG